MVLFNDTFHRRPRMAVASIIARLRREPLSDLPISSCVDQVCVACDHAWRDRLLTPLVTLRLFLLQVLHGNTAIAHLRQLSGLAFAASSYCEARGRLPLEVILALLNAVVQWADEHVRCNARRIGARVLIVDGSNFSTADTPALRQRFGLYPGGKPGVCYPMGKLLGLLDSASGLFMQMLALPVLVYEANYTATLHPLLQSGDILLGDRAFCSFAQVALLNLRGVFGCFRLHQKRKTSRRRGIERWHKPNKAPMWMDAQQFALLPAFVDVRLVSYTIRRTGFRTRQVTVATTLLDKRLWPDAKVAQLYGQRWEIETCFDHLKTTLGMNMLKCQSIDGVMKELAMYLLVYNLVRLAMLRAAADQRVTVNRISFMDALRWLCSRMLGLQGVAELIVNPDRRGRCQPRVIRKRLKAYDLLVRPRREYKTTETSAPNA
jgi:hypothetical protein